jgi:hypothetical protein
MGNVLAKAGLLLSSIFAAVQPLTTTIRREPYLLVQGNLNFTDMLGREYAPQCNYFRHWEGRSFRG